MSDLVFDSLLEVPIDEHDWQEDGDDSVVPVMGHFEPPVSSRTFTLPGVRTLVVPFLGPLKPGNRGNAVRAMARALSHAGYLKWMTSNLTGYFGIRKSRALIAFKKAHGLPADPIYGIGAHKALARYYDSYSIAYLLRGTLDERERENFHAQLAFLYNIRWNVHYTQMRPYDRRRSPHGEDCSSLGEWGSEWAGLPSISGLPRGYGSTYSQLDHLRAEGRVRSTVNQAKLGDPRYYGAPSHVAFWLGRDANGIFRVISNGSYPMKVLRYDYRPDGTAICNLTGR